jgi:subtilisin family serine protease
MGIFHGQFRYRHRGARYGRRFWSPRSGRTDSFFGYDFVNNDSDPSDDNGHGTMCAGIIAACIDNAQGIAGATDCSILPIKVLDSSRGLYQHDHFGNQYAVQAGADIISMSLGTANESAALQKAVSDAYEAGVVVIAASGNSADDVNYPAACQNAIAVARWIKRQSGLLFLLRQRAGSCGRRHGCLQHVLL